MRKNRSPIEQKRFLKPDNYQRKNFQKFVQRIKNRFKCKNINFYENINTLIPTINLILHFHNPPIMTYNYPENIRFAVKEVDMALLFIKEEKENSIPQDSFRQETLEELEKFDLIKKLPNNKYIITPKGTYARQMGAYRYMEMKRSENFFSDYSAEKHKNKKNQIQATFALALMLLIILFVTFKEDFFH